MSTEQKSEIFYVYHKKSCNNKDNISGAVIPSEDTKILDFNQH